MNTEYNMRLIKAYNKRFNLPQQPPVFVYDFAANYIDDDSDKQMFLTGEKILSLVSLFTGYDENLIKSKTRKREIVMARRFYAYGCKLKTKMSLSEIGSIIGGRDHSTVIHLLDTLNDLMETESQTFERVKNFQKLLQSSIDGN